MEEKTKKLKTLKILRIVCLVLGIALFIAGNVFGREKTLDEYKYFQKNGSTGNDYYIKAEKLFYFVQKDSVNKRNGKTEAVLEKYYVYVDDQGNTGVVCLGNLTNDHTENAVKALERYSENSIRYAKADPIYIYGHAKNLSDKVKNYYANEAEGVSKSDLGAVYLDGRITPEKEPYPVVAVAGLAFWITFIVLWVKISSLKKKIKKEMDEIMQAKYSAMAATMDHAFDSSNLQNNFGDFTAGNTNYYPGNDAGNQNPDEDIRIL